MLKQMWCWIRTGHKEYDNVAIKWFTLNQCKYCTKVWIKGIWRK